ncbi:unnamed protein product [Adineta ricciae]|uniref:Uncharacterized protein n=1 Tax=Adineta ricciae TaxID=249248 RepID=A0A816CJI1_ADIRI|nr:unnamed protein product [Adineta ricciae]
MASSKTFKRPIQLSVNEISWASVLTKSRRNQFSSKETKCSIQNIDQTIEINLMGSGSFPRKSANLTSPPRFNMLVLPRPSSSNFDPT